MCTAFLVADITHQLTLIIPSSHTPLHKSRLLHPVYGNHFWCASTQRSHNSIMSLHSILSSLQTPECVTRQTMDAIMSLVNTRHLSDWQLQRIHCYASTDLRDKEVAAVRITEPAGCLRIFPVVRRGREWILVLHQRNTAEVFIVTDRGVPLPTEERRHICGMLQCENQAIKQLPLIKRGDMGAHAGDMGAQVIRFVLLLALGRSLESMRYHDERRDVLELVKALLSDSVPLTGRLVVDERKGDGQSIHIPWQQWMLIRDAIITSDNLIRYDAEQREWQRRKEAGYRQLCAYARAEVMQSLKNSRHDITSHTVYTDDELVSWLYECDINPITNISPVKHQHRGWRECNCELDTAKRWAVQKGKEDPDLYHSTVLLRAHQCLVTPWLYRSFDGRHDRTNEKEREEAAAADAVLLTREDATRLWARERQAARRERDPETVREQENKRQAEYYARNREEILARRRERRRAAAYERGQHVRLQERTRHMSDYRQ